MKLIIDIPDEAKIAFDNAESNDLKGCYYDHGGVIGNAIKNGTPLPKGHWIPLLDNDGSQTLEETYGKVYRCSACGFISYGENFCGNCGLKMEVENE